MRKAGAKVSIKSVKISYLIHERLMVNNKSFYLRFPLASICGIPFHQQTDVKSYLTSTLYKLLKYVPMSWC